MILVLYTLLVPNCVGIWTLIFCFWRIQTCDYVNMKGNYRRLRCYEAFLNFLFFPEKLSRPKSEWTAERCSLSLTVSDLNKTKNRKLAIENKNGKQKQKQKTNRMTPHTERTLTGHTDRDVDSTWPKLIVTLYDPESSLWPTLHDPERAHCDRLYMTRRAHCDRRNLDKKIPC